MAVSALFLTNGAIYANLLPRLPEIKDHFELSNAMYGLALIALPIGGVVAGPLPAPILRRLGTARAAVVGTVILAGAVFLAGSVPLLPVFLAGLFLAGALDAVVDTAQNAQGLRVQRLAGISMINSMHALWSVGAVLGGLMGTAAVALQIPLPVHLGVSGVLFAAVAMVAMRFSLPDSADVPADVVTDTAGQPVIPGSLGKALLVLVPFAVIAMSGVLVEDIGNNWGAVYLRDVLGAAPSVMGLGYVSLVGAQFVGRLLGDRLINAFGEVTMTRAGGALIFLGMGTVILAGNVPLALVGFAVAGFGCATLVPSAYAAADRAPGLKPGTGLTLVSWSMRLVFLISPPVVGALADSMGLKLAMIFVPFMGVLAMIFAGSLRVRGRR